MTKEILINVGITETRVAILEDAKLAEFSVEKHDEQRQAGNIYRGRVANVLPGMQAAFVDIGEDKNAFIFIDDVLPKELENEHRQQKVSIKDLLHEGQELIVQMIKEPIGTKGARVVTQITIPGRYLVLIPGVDYIGISRRIINETERERLKTTITEFKSPEVGLIVRTSAEEIEATELQTEYEFLINVWKKIQKKAKTQPCPSLLYRDHDLLYRILRDYLSKDVHRILIDEPETYSKAIELVKILAPSLKNRIELYHSDLTLFQLYSIESQLEKALRRKVWLDCGAYLVFDQAEALSIIDVNTGKFTGSTSLEETVFQTNLMAAKEIAHQIKLRNLAGIIVIDFIDMGSDEERAKIIAELEMELNRDKIKSNILGFTNLGLLELTRKKVKQSLREMLQIECEFCDGTGYRISMDNRLHQALRSIQQLVKNVDSEAVLLGVNPQIASLLIGPGGINLEKLERTLGKTVFIKGQEQLSTEQIRLLSYGAKAEVEENALPVREGEELELIVTEAHIANPGDGIARIEGYVIDVEGAASCIGKRVKTLVTKTFKTYAKARILN